MLVRYIGDNRAMSTETVQEFPDGCTRVRCADGRIFDVGVRDTVWSDDLGCYIEVFYQNEAQEIYSDWDWRK